MPRRLWDIYLKLEPLDVKVLRVIEKGLSKYEFVPLEYIERRIRASPTRVNRSLDKLNELKLIRRYVGHTTGYTLTYMGLDILALSALVAREVISRLGDTIGVGKEGRIYLAESPAGDLVVVKFHREGRRSFQHIRKLRSYAMQVPRKSWFRVAKLVGEREFKVLAALKDEGAKVPNPIAWNRHAVVQEFIPGVELYRVRDLSVDEAEKILNDIIDTLAIAYQRVGVVHGDLSEYNVLVTEDIEAYIIDWPQFVYKDEPGADELLLRDVRYIANFFKRKYRIQVDIGEILKRVRGG
ncbi:MAG: serine/threonine protein kinase [Desulfurococcales archaeon]|nr:serine/threonine protein kinase [Desulfurococcales archaeon]